ncbi:hypothetical protein [Luteolibacter luteus]|uniref:Uncharacterized protein n=1 Tax=Luteolibacter luteus TaxID=2728835 RepID=A0A858RME3_9BACT|nr:hypothetical protein [Luteolibacter luteus]QJE97992.1 hypothetical protein HHL09_20100 [Luteolibacter luteus]
MKLKGSPAKRAQSTKPVTVTFTGELAEALRARARKTKRKPETVAEWWCTVGWETEPDAQAVRIDVPSRLHAALERLAAAAGYTDGIEELGLETCVPHEFILEGVARSLINLQNLDRSQIAMVAMVLMEEKLRHSQNFADKWIAENTLGMEVNE